MSAQRPSRLESACRATSPVPPWRRECAHAMNFDQTPSRGPPQMPFGLQRPVIVVRVSAARFWAGWKRRRAAVSVNPSHDEPEPRAGYFCGKLPLHRLKRSAPSSKPRGQNHPAVKIPDGGGPEPGNEQPQCEDWRARLAESGFGRLALGSRSPRAAREAHCSDE